MPNLTGCFDRLSYDQHYVILDVWNWYSTVSLGLLPFVDRDLAIRYLSEFEVTYGDRRGVVPKLDHVDAEEALLEIPKIIAIMRRSET